MEPIINSTVITIDPTNDHAFKLTFGVPGNEWILENFLNSVLIAPSYIPIRGLTLRNPYIPGMRLFGRSIVYDVRSDDVLRRKFFVEMQNVINRAFTNRLYIYLGSTHRRQL